MSEVEAETRACQASATCLLLWNTPKAPALSSRTVGGRARQPALAQAISTKEQGQAVQFASYVGSKFTMMVDESC